MNKGINFFEIMEGEENVLLHIISEKYGIRIIKIDLDDYEKVCKHHWYIRFYKKNYYAYTHIGNYKYLGLHRLITNAPTGKMVDHINHNTLDNRKCNLKICTNKENQHNRNGIEGIKKTNWGYQVQMRVNGKLKCFGTYKTMEEAKQIRINAEKEYRPYVKEIKKYG